MIKRAFCKSAAAKTTWQMLVISFAADGAQGTINALMHLMLS